MLAFSLHNQSGVYKDSNKNDKSYFIHLKFVLYQ